MITIIDVIRELHLEPRKRLTWSVGLRVALAWKRENGEQPEKRNREKTSGNGVHCFAVYPVSFKPVIIAHIAEQCAEEARQYEMDL